MKFLNLDWPRVIRTPRVFFLLPHFVTGGVTPSCGFVWRDWSSFEVYNNEFAPWKVGRNSKGSSSSRIMAFTGELLNFGGCNGFEKRDLFLFLELVIFVGWYFWIDPENDLMVDSKKHPPRLNPSIWYECDVSFIDIPRLWRTANLAWFTAKTCDQIRQRHESVGFGWFPFEPPEIASSNINILSCSSLRKRIARDRWRKFLKDSDTCLQILNLWTRS